MHCLTSNLIASSLITTALAAYRASVPCFDTTIPDEYHTACTVTNSLGASDSWRFTPNALFTCDGNVPGIYWNTLQGLGLGTCVCGYISSDSGTWYYQEEYGTCNGACTATFFTCDGTTPIAGESTTSTTSSESLITSSTTQPVVISTSSVSTTSSESHVSSSTTQSVVTSASSAASNGITADDLTSLVVGLVLAALGMI